MLNFRTLFYSYALFLVLIAVLPINGPGSGMNDIYVVDLRLDYLLHAAVFVPLFFLLRKAFPANRTSFFVLRKLYFLLPLALLFAAFCEAIQLPLTYRAFNLNDLVANMVGVVVGFGVWWIYMRVV